MLPPARPSCLRCRRPEQVCVCAYLRPVESRTRVVFLQHPREARMPISTCRLAHLSLPNSEIHVGLRAEGSPRLEALAAAAGTMVLFPGATTTDVRALGTPPSAIIVVDGTWVNARKVIQRSPLLRALPRIGFIPTQPSAYRIRREPAPHCVSTIEAVATVLESLERDPGRFAPVLGSFHRMVDLQLAYVPAGGLTGTVSRHAKKAPATDLVRGLGDRLVLVFAESHAVREGGYSLLEWVGVRPTTGERFACRVALDGSLAPHRLRAVDGAIASETECMEDAIARWLRFAGANAVLGTWGRFPVDLLRAAGVDCGESLDMKRLISDYVKAPVGGVEHLAESLDASLPAGHGRARRRLVALEAVVRAFLSGRLTRR